MNDQTIRNLALQAAQGSVDAFQELYRLTRQGAWFVALSIAKNEHDAQDILQESYLKAYKNMGQLDNPERFTAWLNQIVANQAKNYISRKKPDSFAEYEDENAQDWQEETNPDFIPDEHLDQAEAKALIAAHVQALPEDQRLVVLLRYYDDMDVSAIAKSLEIPEGTVKSRLARARQKLAAMLQEAQDKGLKLYSIAPIPLLAYFIKLIGFDAASSDRLPPLLIGSAAAGAAGGAAAAAKTTTKASALTGKVAAAVTAAVVTVSGITVAGVYAFNNRSPAIGDPPAPTTQVALVSGAYEVSAADSTAELPSIAPQNPWHVSSAQPAANNEGPSAAVSRAPDDTTAAATATAASTTTVTSTATVAGTSETTAATTRTSLVFPTWTTRATTTTTTTTTTTPWQSVQQTTTTTTTTASTTAKPAFSYQVGGDGYLTITAYNGTAAEVVIPSKIDGIEVRHLGANLFAGSNVKRVVITEGPDCLGSSMFANCAALEEVVIPNSVRFFQTNAFTDSPQVTIVCEDGSKAHAFALENNIPFRLQTP